jgi:hypothetical protein
MRSALQWKTLAEYIASFLYVGFLAAIVVALVILFESFLRFAIFTR